MADGRLYLRTERGEMILIEPNRERYVERGRFRQPGRTRQPAWTHPVIANGKLYIRDQDVLFCYDIKRSDAASLRRTPSVSASTTAIRSCGGRSRGGLSSGGRCRPPAM